MLREKKSLWVRILEAKYGVIGYKLTVTQKKWEFWGLYKIKLRDKKMCYFRSMIG